MLLIVLVISLFLPVTASGSDETTVMWCLKWFTEGTEWALKQCDVHGEHIYKYITYLTRLEANSQVEYQIVTFNIIAAILRLNKEN